MYSIIKKDITTVPRGIIAHGCNCLGVQGAGVAAAIARKFPKQHKVYVDLHKIHSDDRYPSRRPELLGSVQFVEETKDLVIANCFTQVDVGMSENGQPPASFNAIRSSLRQCLIMAKTLDMPLFIPQIGCGLGGLKWESNSPTEQDVRSIYEEVAMQFADVDWYVCTL